MSDTLLLIGLLPVLMLALVIERIVYGRRRARAVQIITCGLDAQLLAQSFAFRGALDAAVWQLEHAATLDLLLLTPAFVDAPVSDTTHARPWQGPSVVPTLRPDAWRSNATRFENSNLGGDRTNDNPPAVSVRGRIARGALQTFRCHTCGTDLMQHAEAARAQGCPTCHAIGMRDADVRGQVA